MISSDHLKELAELCGEAKEISESGQVYIYLARLTLRVGSQPKQLEALLCPHSRDGYATRLFLSEPVLGRGNNWSVHRILDRTWHTWSWNGVSSQLRPTEILAEHIRALQ
jgi:hypothetical protein